MTEHDAMHHDHHDDIRSALHGAATTIDIGDTAAARVEVHATARRRRTRVRALSGLAVVAVVVGGAVTVMSLDGSDGSETLVGADATVAESEDSVAPADDAATTAAVRVVVVDGSPTASAMAGVGGAPEYAEWVTPWKNGFLTASIQYPPQPLPAELPEDVVALFPPEVVALFQEDRPATINESIERLEAAGLLDEVQAVLAENPAANEAIYGAPAVEEPVIEARFTVDGITWEPVDMTLPPGASYLAAVTAVGDRLAVAYGGEEGGVTPTNTVRVAVTSDLATWDVQDVVVPTPPDLPPELTLSANPVGFAASDDRWVLTVGSGVGADLLGLLPDAVRADIEARSPGGMGFNTDERGATFDLVAEDGTTSETITYTWEELGISPDVAEYVLNPGFEIGVWSAPWGGEPQRSDESGSSGLLLATDAGFLQWSDQLSFSTDGLSWSPAAAFEDGFVTGAFTYEGGVIVAVSEPDGTSFFRLDPTGQRPEPLVIDGLPDRVQAYTGVGSSTRGALVVDAAAIPEMEPLSVEDGTFRAAVDPGSGAIEVVEVATGAVRASGRLAPESDTFMVDENGLTVTDAATGEVIVVFPMDLLEASEEMTAPAAESAADMRILVTTDGETFLLLDANGDDDAEFGPVAASSDGERLLVSSGSRWSIYDLP